MTKDMGNGIQEGNGLGYIQISIRIDKGIVEAVKEVKGDAEMTKLSDTYRYILRLGVQQYWKEKRYGKVVRKRQAIR